MKSHQIKPDSLFPFYFVLLTGLAALSAPAATLYVNVNNTAPAPPYTTWATAATNIQNAVDVAVAGDEIAVTNGIYQVGEKMWPPGSETNRLAVTKPLNVHSVNGSDVTIIDGGGAIRCVYLVADTTLTGFALTNGCAVKGGGLYCESNSASVSNCVFIANTGTYFSATGAGAYGGTLTKCTFTSNRAPSGSGGGAANAMLNDCLLSTNRVAGGGGGAMNCNLNNCILKGNNADSGGGASQCNLNNCSLIYNFAETDGGGANHCTLNNCTLNGNLGYDFSGGAAFSTLDNCTIANNTAFLNGGGARFSTLNNCTIANNLADSGVGGGTVSCTLNNCVLINNRAYNYQHTGFGGGAYGGTLNNCTLTGNQSDGAGGGASGATLNNCIVYYNTASQDLDYDSYCTLNYCCTTPMPTNGIGNFTNEPLFVDLAIGNLRLQPGSPCINAGNNSYVTNSTDLDGHPRISGGTVDVGAYEFVLARQLFSSMLSGNNYCFSFDTESNRTYIIEYKNALTDPAWNSFPAIIGNGQMLTITNPIPGAPQRFYRLRAD